MSIVRQVRALLRPQNPFILGAYPDRVAPAHVMNGYVAALLGVSERGMRVQGLVAPGEHERSIDAFPALSNAEWPRDPVKVSAFCDALSHVFNPDRRVWKDKGSLVPVHSHFATKDPSDEGYGPLIWGLISRHVPHDYEYRLSELLSPTEARDPITACALLLTKDAQTGGRREIGDADANWFQSQRTTAEEVLAKSLASFIDRLTRPLKTAERLLQIQHLGRGLYLATLLTLLLEPLASRCRDTVETVDQIGKMVVWGDTPPGASGHPMVMASERSFQLLIADNHAALIEELSEALGNVEFPSHLPPDQRRRTALRTRLMVAGVRQADVEKAIDDIAEAAHVAVNGEALPDCEWCKQVIDKAYPPDTLTQGFRSMGRKVGFVGPNRGAGKPRFFCETPLLGTLVAGLCPPEGMEFEQFVDLVRRRLGLLFGPGTDEETVNDTGLWEGLGIGRRLMVENQEALRRRLVRAGLAREYSDGHTEVFYDDY